jgi:hypothetical protein
MVDPRTSMPEIKATLDLFGDQLITCSDIHYDLANDDGLAISVSIYRAAGANMTKYAMACVVRSPMGTIMVNEILQAPSLMAEHAAMFSDEPGLDSSCFIPTHYIMTPTSFALVFKIAESRERTIFFERLRRPMGRLKRRVVQLEREVSALCARFDADAKAA